MAKVKLDLQRKDYFTLRSFAQSHRDALVENANYPTPQPTAVAFDGALGAFSTKLDEISAAEVTLQTLRAERDVLRTALEANLNSRGTYVDTASGGDLAKILSAAFRIRALGPNDLESPWSDEAICMAP